LRKRIAHIRTKRLMKRRSRQRNMIRRISAQFNSVRIKKAISK
jgi:hypothetical protein